MTDPNFVAQGLTECPCIVSVKIEVTSLFFNYFPKVILYIYYTTEPATIASRTQPQLYQRYD